LLQLCAAPLSLQQQQGLQAGPRLLVVLQLVRKAQVLLLVLHAARVVHVT
jgi:hypothetical protein